MSSSQLRRKPNPVAPAPVLAALVLLLSGCCLDLAGQSIHSSTGGSTTGSSDSGPPTGTLWIDGIGAIDTNGCPASGPVAFSETCVYPLSAPVIGGLGGVAAIDASGDLWAQQTINSLGTLYVWTPEQLSEACATSGPTRTVNVQPFLTAIAFDSDGNLWGVSEAEPTAPQGLVVGYRAADIATSGSPSPAWTLSGDCSSLDSLCNPVGLAFDSDGYLWVGDYIGLHAFSPATRTGPDDGGSGGTGPLADFHITTPCVALAYDAGGSECIDGMDQFNDLAFDSEGNLWVSTDASLGAFELIAFSRAQLENAARDDQPRPVFETGIAAFINASAQNPLAFDADGNLWVGVLATSPDGGGPNLFRFPRAVVALGAGAIPSAVPDVAIAVPGDASLSLAFSPIPPGLPLQP